MANEWSQEVRGDQALFELLCLEGAQAGLSWLTILRKREAYRQAFGQFDPHSIAQMTDDDVQRLLDQEPDKTRTRGGRYVIVRHRGKIQAVLRNAKCLLQLQQEQPEHNDTTDAFQHGALDAFLWSFVENKPILNSFALERTERTTTHH